MTVVEFILGFVLIGGAVALVLIPIILLIHWLSGKKIKKNIPKDMPERIAKEKEKQKEVLNARTEREERKRLENQVPRTEEVVPREELQVEGIPTSRVDFESTDSEPEVIGGTEENPESNRRTRRRRLVRRRRG